MAYLHTPCVVLSRQARVPGPSSFVIVHFVLNDIILSFAFRIAFHQ